MSLLHTDFIFFWLYTQQWVNCYQIVAPFLIFCAPSVPFSAMDVLKYLTTTSVQAFLSLTSLLAFFP
jgi:hypothetical protein